MTGRSRSSETSASRSSSGESAAGACRLDLTESERRWLDGPLSALTPREREVALAICEGGDHERVAASLCIAVPTLRTHLMRINQKLGAENKVDVVRFVAARLLEAYRTGGQAGVREGESASKSVVINGLEAKSPARAAS